MTVRPEVALRFGPYWRLSILEAAEGGVVPPLDATWLCGACASSQLLAVGSGGYGSAAGGEHWTEVQCAECGAITEYRHEWG